MDTSLICYQFAAHFGAQTEEVLELQGLDCQFAGSFGVLKSMHFEVSSGQRGFEVFFVNLRLQSDLLLRCHLMFTLRFLSMK